MAAMSARGTFIVPVHDLDVDGRDADLPDHRGVAARGARGVRNAARRARRAARGALHQDAATTCWSRARSTCELVIPCARCLKTGRASPQHRAGAPAPPHDAAANPAKRPERRAPSGPGRKSRRSEFTPDEADVDTYEGDEVVLDRFVREAILLESPIFPLCSEACEGIRPASDSASLTGQAVTDPRLLPLLELAKRRNMKE